MKTPNLSLRGLQSRPWQSRGQSLKAIFVISFLFPILSHADEIKGFKKDGNQLLIQYKLGKNDWAVDNHLCLYSDDTRQACGKILKIKKNKAQGVMIVSLFKPPRDLSKGQQIELRTAGRGVASTGIEQIVRRDHDYTFNVAAALAGGHNYFFPELLIQVAVMPQLSLGVEPIYVDFKSSNSSQVKAVGGFLNATYYYTHYAFRGVYFQGGVGYYSLDLKVNNTTEKISPLAGQALVGWRGKAYWSLGMDFGLALGAQYVAADPKVIQTSFKGLLPVIRVDVGFSF